VRAALVVAQVALAFALLSGGGLALLRVNQLLGTPLGYDPTGVVDLRLIGVPAKDASAQQQRATLERILRRVAALPHVEAVAANGTVPLTGYDGLTDIEVEGRGGAPRVSVARNTITPGYLELMRIPLVRGRQLSAGDEPGDTPAVLISQSLANKLFPGQDPLGQRIRHVTLDGDFLTIVGVVGDLRRDGPGGAYSFETYAPLMDWGVVAIRTDDPGRVRRELPAAVASVEPTVGTWIRTLPERVRRSAWDSIRISILLGAFAAIALVLSAVGLYAMVSYATLLETRELGIRSALGAPPRAVVWLVMRRGLCWLGIGGALGLVAALALGQSLAALMPGARSFDLGVFLIVGAALLGAGSVAAFLPARRAVRASPALALRYE
jgi:putative ABC transport system permease protein